MSIVVAISPSSFADGDDTPRRLLEEASVQIKENPYGRRLTEAEIIEHLEGVDGLLAGLEPLNRKVIASAAPRLKAIARVGIGVTNVDFEAAEEFGVKVSNTPDAPVTAVAELTLCALLALCRRLVPTNAGMHAGEWPKAIGFGLSRAKVLLIGYGRIGQRVGALLRAFGAELLVYDPCLDSGTLQHAERLRTLAEGLPQADIISLHANGEDTILEADAFEMMRDGVILLNSARGALVDEDALVAALDSGKVAGAWFDAFWEEPYQGRLTQYEQVLLTPHVGTYTYQCRRDMETVAVRHLLRDLGL